MKNKRTYAHVLICAIFIIAAFVVVLAVSKEKGYLYFDKTSFTTQFGDSVDIEDIGLTHSMSLDKIVFEKNDFVKIANGKISFVRAGDFDLIAKSGKLKASLSIKVLFEDVDEYFNFSITKDRETSALVGGDIVNLYLPSQDGDKAAQDGYVNDFDFGVEYLKQHFACKIVMTKDILRVKDGNFTAISPGNTRVDVYFDPLGKCLSFMVNIVKINATNIVSSYTDNSIFVEVGEVFKPDVNVLPSYATEKIFDIDIVGDNLSKTKDGFVAEKLGIGYIKYSIDDITFTLKVIVCEKPDELKVTLFDDFVFGEIGSASVYAYKDNAIIDAEFIFECYYNDMLVNIEDILEDFSFERNILKGKVKISEKFMIKVICKSNQSVVFEIWGNN